jgi:hypothetical protein
VIWRTFRPVAARDFPMPEFVRYNPTLLFWPRRRTVAEWHYAQADPSEELAQLSLYSMKKVQDGREIDFRITVREYAQRPAAQHSRFFAEADKQVNQKTAAVLPYGWGNSTLEALADCMRMIRQFPYED